MENSLHLARRKFRLTVLVVAAVSVLASFFIFQSGQGAADFDGEFFAKRAKELARFEEGEIVPEPEIVFALAGEESLREAPLSVGERVVTIFDPGYGLGGVQAVFRAPKYEIQDGKKRLEMPSFKGTVGEIIADVGLVLAREDIVAPRPEAPPPTDNEIKITRVSIAEIETIETLPYRVREIDDPSLERGSRTVAQKGVEGKRRLVYQVRREDGQEVSRRLTKDELATAPQDKIIKVGTKVVVLSSISGEASWTNGVTAMRRYRRGTLIRVTNLANGKSVEATVGGWGPQEFTGRILDLERELFEKIASVGAGLANVKVEELKK